MAGHAEGDIARAQPLALQGLHSHLRVIKQHSHRFLEGFNEEMSYADVRVPIAGKWTTPIGTAPGVEPDADGLEPLSYLYGLQMPGPFSLGPRRPTAMPFQEDARREDLFVPPTYASQGLEYAVDRLRTHREGGSRSVILPALASNCHSSADTSHRLQEIQTMAEALTPYVDGFVWMPALTGRSGDWDRQDFRSAAQLMSAAAPGRLLLVEMPTFEQPDELAWLDLVGAFVDGGAMVSLP